MALSLAAGLLFSAVAGSSPGNGSIAVVSILGDRFTSVSLGSTAFDKSVRVTRTGPWRMDDFVESTIRDMLRENPALRLSGLRFRRGRLAKIYDTGNQGILEGGDYDLDNIANVLSAMRRKRIDTLVLVIAREMEDPIEEASHVFRGYGMYRNIWLGTDHYLYAYFSVLVIDVARGEISHASNVPGYQEIDKKLWGETLNELEPSGRYVVKDALQHLIATEVADALAEAGLVSTAAAKKKRRKEERRPGLRATSGDYTQAVRRVYYALGVRDVFERHARNYVRRRMDGRGDLDLYADAIRSWVDERFSWEQVRGALVLFYTRLGLSVDELNDMAALAESRRRFAPPSRESARRLLEVWRRVVDDEGLDDLRRAVEDRRQAILREAGQLRRLRRR